MATEAQILANRRNCQKSTGPCSTEGKTVVSQNAVKHGLSASKDLISSESQEEFDLHRRQVLDELNPVTPMESILADRIVGLSWRLNRICIFQNQAIDTLKAGPARFEKLYRSLTANIAGKPLKGADGSDDKFPLGRLAVKDFSNARVLDRLLMYERRIEHSLYKTILELQRLQLAQKFKTQLGI